ncbi:hypothetical protein B1808_10210 [Pseudofulvimonas gallinarii]|nr:hypothetical protein B1808_10210 [Pseudofulvimonas gallinarii]
MRNAPGSRREYLHPACSGPDGVEIKKRPKGNRWSPDAPADGPDASAAASASIRLRRRTGRVQSASRSTTRL